MCGIFGIYGDPEASNLTYLGLHGLQHRGQESAGIVSSDQRRLYSYRGMGLVVDVFNERTLGQLKGNLAIGHVRYATCGESDLANAQPLAVSHAHGQLAVAHNGNLVNAGSLRQKLEEHGSIFSTTVDSEVIVHLFANTPGRKIVDRIATTLSQVRGAYSVLFLTERKLIAARDPYGFRPLCIGELRHQTRRRNVAAANGPTYVFASETGVFDLIGAEYQRALDPGEVVMVDRQGLRCFHPFKDLGLPAVQPKFCVFEHVYFARPDTLLGPRSVYNSRRALGRRLAKEHPVAADVVIPVPDSGTTAALGYAEQAQIPFEMGLIRSHYVGRTFIEPEQSIRHFGVRLKLAPVRSVLQGKRVVVVDDSLVRGTTSHKIVAMLKGAGATEVHLRISSPPVRHPCPYGIDIPTTAELIATDRAESDIRDFVGADSLGYVSREGMLAAIDGERANCYCDACFTGDYPIPFEGPQRIRPLPGLPG